MNLPVKISSNGFMRTTHVLIFQRLCISLYWFVFGQLLCSHISTVMFFSQVLCSLVYMLLLLIVLSKRCKAKMYGACNMIKIMPQFHRTTRRFRNTFGKRGDTTFQPAYRQRSINSHSRSITEFLMPYECVKYNICKVL